METPSLTSSCPRSQGRASGLKGAQKQLGPSHCAEDAQLLKKVHHVSADGPALGLGEEGARALLVR